jgi:hypothetical protein
MKFTINTDTKTIEVHGQVPLKEVEKLAKGLQEIYEWEKVDIQGTGNQAGNEILDRLFHNPTVNFA